MTTTPLTPATFTTHATRLPVRLPHLAAGLALLTLTTYLAYAWSTGVSSVLVFALLPDVAFVLALGRPVQPGQLSPRAVPAYNLLHRPLLPVVLLALAAAGVLGQYWVVAGLAWWAHIAIDRGVGYGLRSKDGWQRG